MSTELPCSKDGAKISCSKISMAVSGAPEVESIRIFSGKNEVELIQTDPERIVFASPQKPEKITSVLINGEEYLKQKAAAQ